MVFGQIVLLMDSQPNLCIYVRQRIHVRSVLRVKLMCNGVYNDNVLFIVLFLPAAGQPAHFVWYNSHRS